MVTWFVGEVAKALSRDLILSLLITLLPLAGNNVDDITNSAYVDV
jgi:hypothetical protein